MNDPAGKTRPRAEYRVFGQGIIELVGRRMWGARATLGDIRRSKEVYILSRRTNAANVKIRSGQLQAKIRAGKTGDGYELYQPAGRFRFPLDPAARTVVSQYLQVPIEAEKSPLSRKQFLNLVADTSDLDIVEVRKNRHGFTVRGLLCEYVEILVNGAAIESACVEGDDYAAMKAVIAILGLGSFTNTNYVKALKKIIGG